MSVTCAELCRVSEDSNSLIMNVVVGLERVPVHCPSPLPAVDPVDPIAPSFLLGTMIAPPTVILGAYKRPSSGGGSERERRVCVVDADVPVGAVVVAAPQA